MKYFMAVLALAVTTFNGEALAANVGHPDFYGRLNTNGYQRPQVIYRQPIAIERVPIYSKSDLI